MDIAFFLQFTGALCDGNSSAAPSVPASSSSLSAGSAASLTSSLSADPSAVPSATIEPTSTAPSISAAPTTVVASSPGSSPGTSPGTSPSTTTINAAPATTSRASLSFTDSTVTDVYTGTVWASTALAKVCICSGSTFASHLYTTTEDRATNYLPCASTTMPTSATSLLLASSPLAPAASDSKPSDGALVAGSISTTTATNALGVLETATASAGHPAGTYPLSMPQGGPELYPCNYGKYVTESGVDRTTTPLCICGGKTFAASPYISGSLSNPCGYTASPTSALSIVAAVYTPKVSLTEPLPAPTKKNPPHQKTHTLTKTIGGGATLNSPAIDSPPPPASPTPAPCEPSPASTYNHFQILLVKSPGIKSGYKYYAMLPPLEGEGRCHKFKSAEVEDRFARNEAGDTLPTGEDAFDIIPRGDFCFDLGPMHFQSRCDKISYEVTTKNDPDRPAAVCVLPDPNQEVVKCDTGAAWHPRTFKTVLECYGPTWCERREGKRDGDVGRVPAAFSSIDSPSAGRAQFSTSLLTTTHTAIASTGMVLPSTIDIVAGGAPRDLSVASLFAEALNPSGSSPVSLPSTAEAITLFTNPEPDTPSAALKLGRSTCIDQHEVTTTGTAKLYVYQAQFCVPTANGTCDDPNALGIVGMVRHSAANCAWFQRSGREGYHIFHYPGDHYAWQNSYDVHEFPAAENLTIANGGHYCMLNNMTFEKRCDGTYLAISSGQGGQAVCRQNCVWPGTEDATIRCDHPGGGFSLEAKCFLECIGDFCPADETDVGSDQKTEVLATDAAGKEPEGEHALEGHTEPATAAPAEEPTSCAPGQAAVTPSGEGVLYVYRYRECIRTADPPCDPAGQEHFGMVRHSRADCMWFTSNSDFPKPGASAMFEFDKIYLKSFPNQYDSGAISGPEVLQISNLYNFCRLNNVKFEQQCDGSYLAISSRQGGRSRCIRDCKWPVADSVNLDCPRKASPDVADPVYWNVTCYMKCAGDFCSPVETDKQPAQRARNALPSENEQVLPASSAPHHTLDVRATGLPEPVQMPTLSGDCRLKRPAGRSPFNIIQVTPTAGAPEYTALLPLLSTKDSIEQRCATLLRQPHDPAFSGSRGDALDDMLGDLGHLNYVGGFSALVSNGICRLGELFFECQCDGSHTSLVQDTTGTGLAICRVAEQREAEYACRRGDETTAFVVRNELECYGDFCSAPEDRPVPLATTKTEAASTKPWNALSVLEQAEATFTALP